jgi:hypothetical protein
MPGLECSAIWQFLLRPDDQRTALAHRFGDGAQNLSLYVWLEVDQDYVAAEDQVERPFGLFVSNVLFEESDASLEFVAEAKRVLFGSGLVERALPPLLRELVQTPVRIAAGSRSLQHMLLGVGRDDFEFHVIEFPPDIEAPAQLKRKRLLARRTSDAPGAQALAASTGRSPGQRGQYVSAQRVPRAAPAIEFGNCDSAEFIELVPFLVMPLEILAILVESAQAQLDESVANPPTDLAANLAVPRPSSVKLGQRPFEELDQIVVAHTFNRRY